jgi:hypothetical protein
MYAAEGTTARAGQAAMKPAPATGAKDAMPSMKPAKSISSKNLGKEHR